MTTKKQIKDFSQKLAQTFHPDKIVLFGSYAYGKPQSDSDVDMMVIMPFEGHPVDKSVEMRIKLRPSFPLDLLVRSPSAIRERLRKGDGFVKDVLSKGQVLYEAPY